MLLRCITLLYCHVFPHRYLYTQHRLSTCDVMMFCHIGWYFDHNARKSPLRGDGERKGRGDLLSQNLVTKCCYKMLSQNVVIECCHKMSSQNIVTECCHKMFSQNALCIMHYAVRFKMCSICCVQCIVPSRYWLFVYFVSLPLTLFIPRPLLYLTSIYFTSFADSGPHVVGDRIFI